MLQIQTMSQANPNYLQVVKLSSQATLPTKSSCQSAGFDLYSAYDYIIKPFGKRLIKTDIQICLPCGTYGRIAPRSSLALNNHIDIGAGVIDEDYRGNICIIIFNHSDKEFFVKKGDSVAQLICEKIEYPQLIEVSSLNVTKRNKRGLGQLTND